MQKTAKRTMILIMIAIVSVLMVAQIAKAAGLVGSKHDLSLAGNSVKATGTAIEICVFCHAPHNAGTTSPLWNRTNPAGASFTVYGASSAGATGKTAAETTVSAPGSVSLACLSCHDGATAVSSITNTPATMTIASTVPTDGKIPVSSAALIGISLTNDHPIGVAYPTTATGLYAFYTAYTAGDKKVGTLNLPLFSDKVECASCHDVHTPTNGSFLRASNSGSALCKNCHTK
jgi:predicted CXXCH cytochrome family protein